MSKHLEHDLELLEREVLSVAALVEQMMAKACRALLEKRADLAREVIDSDATVDEREVQIEEDCLKVIALHQPVAIDLRRVAATLKINNDLERVADLAVNVSERAQRLESFPDFEIPDSLQRMATLASSMVRQALDAFVNLNPEAAREVCAMDDDVDRQCGEVTNQLFALMRSDADSIEPALHCYTATRHIERIADHATNIAEDVIYLVRGDITRHRHNEIAT